MNERLHDFLLQLPRENLINLMEMAVDEMQSYNGRTIDFCILTALEAKPLDETKWKFPTLAHARNLTNVGYPVG